MEQLRFKVEGMYCYDCVRALRNFISSIKGIESVEVEDNTVVVIFDSAKISPEEVRRLVSDSIGRLGYKLSD